MPVETNLWRIHDSGLIEAQRSHLQSEAQLEEWIKENPRLISTDLLLIGSQVPTPHGGRIDLLGIDSTGTIHVIELKANKTPREVVAQALDYASWVVSLTDVELDKYCRDYHKMELETAFKKYFVVDSLPNIPNAQPAPSITIVASALDPASERIVKYLSEQYNVDINVVFFTVFEDNLGKALTRSWLIDPQEVATRSEERVEHKKQEWTGYYFVNIGVGNETNRSWNDARKYGYVSAGGAPRFKSFMQKLHPGDKIFGYVKEKGYVGYGIVTAPAVMAKNFQLTNGDRLLDQQLESTDIAKNLDVEDRAEYVVAVDWKSTVDENHAKKYLKIFSIQQVVCKIYEAETARFLENEFGIAGVTAETNTFSTLEAE